MAAYLPPESAVRRHLDKHWQRTGEVDLLREIEHGIRYTAWILLRQGGQKRAEYPEPLGLPWDPDPEGTVKGDVMTLEDWDRHLGWDKLKAAGQATEEGP